MRLNICDPNLKKIDKKYNEFNILYNVFLDQLNRIANPIALKEIRTNLKKIKNDLAKIKPVAEFDKLVLENLKHAVRSQEKYAKFFCQKTSFSYEDIISDINGRNWLKLTLSNLKSYDYEANWEMIKLNSGYYGHIIYPDDPQARQLIEKLLPRVKKIVLDYGNKIGLIPKSFDFELSLMPTHRHRSHYLPEINRLELDSNEFICYVHDGQLHIDFISVLRTMFHEILGHAAHRLASEKLPLCLQFNQANSFMHVTRPHQEGIAIFQHGKIIDAIKNNKQKIEFTKADLRRTMLDESVTKSNMSYHLYFSYLKAKKKYDPKFNVYKELLKATGNYGIARNYKEMPVYHDIVLLREFSYLTGFTMIKDIEKKYSKKLSDKKFQKIFNQALLTGCWSWKVLPKFVDYYIRNSI